MADSIDGTAPAAQTRRLILRLHLATYLALLLMSGLLMLLIVPGEFVDHAEGDEMLGVDPFTFEHGWPCVYLTRRQKFDDTLIKQIETAYQTASPPPVAVPHHGVPWLQSWGWTFHGDIGGDPDWLYRGAQIWSVWGLVVDILVGLLLLLSLAVGLEWRQRRRPLWRFSLLEFAAAMLLISTALGWWVYQTQGSRRERELDRDQPTGLFVFEYRGPLWLRRFVGTTYLHRLERVVEIDTLTSSEPQIRQLLESAVSIPYLRSLTIRQKSPIEGGLPHLDKLVQLQELHLQLPLADEDLARLRNLRNLRQLTALDCDYNSRDGLTNLARLKNLEVLRLDGKGIDNRGIRCLTLLPKLKSLDLKGCDIDDDALHTIGQLKELQVLGLANTKVKGHGLADLARLKHLLTISLSGTRVGDIDLKHLNELQGLTRIDLYHTQVTDAGFQELQRLHPQSQIVK